MAKTPTKKQTSSKLSSIAARYTKVTRTSLQQALDNNPIALVREIRAIAATALSQDEKRGR